MAKRPDPIEQERHQNLWTIVELYYRSHIIFRHLLPTCYSHIIVIATLAIPGMILGETTLSFIGLGVQEPTAAWGLMLRGAAVEFAETAPWMAVFPGLAISLSVFAFNLFGDSLRDGGDERDQEEGGPDPVEHGGRAAL